jgi:hypothetical protein
MRIGGKYGVEATSGRHWRRFAQANLLDPDKVIERVDDLAGRTADVFSTAAEDEAGKALQSRLPGRLVDRIATRVTRCHRQLEELSCNPVSTMVIRAALVPRPVRLQLAGQDDLSRLGPVQRLDTGRVDLIA